MNNLPSRQVFQAGLSLSEILVTLSIASILVTSALPDLSDLLMANRVATLSNELLAAMQLTRSEAIKRNMDVTICKSNNATSCSGHWSDGWIIFVDRDGDKQLDPADGDTLIRIHTLDEKRFNITWNAFRSDNYIRYSAQGFIHSNNGTFILCPSDRDARHARAIIINRVGRARVSRDSNKDGIHENSRGLPLVC
jgi:type IV fimbrial biogenesis protein FimT